VTTPETEKTSRAPLYGAGIVIVVVLLLAFGSRLVRDDEMYSGTDKTANEQATAVALSLPTQDNARCMPVEPATLSKAETAFDGEVLTVDADTVTLAVREWYAGGDKAAQVRLDLAKVPQTLTGYFDFAKGSRYLVAANDDTVLVCGFSGPWSKDLEQIYTAAF
jgi:hypothetical protein